MGFSSYKCTGCSLSIIAPAVVADRRGLSWLYTVHLAEPKGREVVGVYDGYGRIVTIEFLQEFAETVTKTRDELLVWLRHTRGQGPGLQVSRLSVVMPAINSLYTAEANHPGVYEVKNSPGKGYGAVVDLRHYACWQVAGEPGFEHASERAPDQGYFGDWNRIKAPTTQADIEKLRKKAAKMVPTI
jgi:hypothetical protein